MKTQQPKSQKQGQIWISCLKEPTPGGYFQIRRSGGGGSWTSHQVWRQNLGQGPAKFTKQEEKLRKFCHHKTQELGEVSILGSYLKFRGQNLGYLSLIFLEAKYGAPTRLSEANFGAKPPSRPPDMEVPPWGANILSEKLAHKIGSDF